MGTPATLKKHPTSDCSPASSHPLKQNLLPVGLSSSPALTTDPAGDAAIADPPFLTCPCPLPPAATAVGAPGSSEAVGALARWWVLWRLCGQRGSCLALFKAA